MKSSDTKKPSDLPPQARAQRLRVLVEKILVRIADEKKEKVKP